MGNMGFLSKVTILISLAEFTESTEKIFLGDVIRDS